MIQQLIRDFVKCNKYNRRYIKTVREVWVRKNISKKPYNPATLALAGLVRLNPDVADAIEIVSQASITGGI